MESYRAIPPGYMTVGELAKRMNTTVRTLQYYDKEGLLSPSAESDGGRRLYTDRDVVTLHQIQSMKYLGFSLSDIKDRLVSLDTPAQVADALTEQARVIKEKIAALSEALGAVEKLRAETLQMKTVDFKKYAVIVTLLQLENEDYWVVKHLDGKMLSHVQNHFDVVGSKAILDTWKRLCEEVIALQRNGAAPDSKEGQAVAKAWWDMVMEFTGGDMSLFPELIKFSESRDDWDEEWREKQAGADAFIQEALPAYFANLGINPFEDVNNDRIKEI